MTCYLEVLGSIVFFMKDWFKGILLRYDIQYLLQSDHFDVVPVIACKRHEFNKADMEGKIPGQRHKFVDFIVIDSLHGNHIHFYTQAELRHVVNIVVYLLKIISFGE